MTVYLFCRRRSIPNCPLNTDGSKLIDQKPSTGASLTVSLCTVFPS